jgi:tripartite-type tricarboxylate transporter receptor subunit TctC
MHGGANLATAKGRAKKRPSGGNMLIRLTVIAILACFASSPRAETAPPHSEFYRAKTIALVTSTGAGGTYDLVARLIARHMPRHIPGNPAMIVQNMPGGGNVLATNYMYNIAPQDGTAIAAIHSAMPLHQVLDGSGVRYDASKFNWLGSTGAQNEVILVWHTAGIETIKDAMDREVILGGTGAGSGIVIIPTLMNGLLGTRFKVVTGYRTSEEVNLGMQRGEVEARAFGFASITSQHPDWITEKKVVFLAQAGSRRDRLLPNVPLLTELAKNEEQRRIMQLVSSAPALGQPYVAPPGVPLERLAILRAAFVATLSDQAFLADAEKLRFDVEPMTAEETGQIVHQTINAPQDVVSQARAAISGR